MYKHMSSAWKKRGEDLAEIQRKRMVQWRSEPTVTRIEGPTRLDRARILGYKAKQGVAVARVRVTRGGRKIPKRAGGRKPRSAGRFFTLGKSKQQTAEEKAATRFRNMEVLNSYWVGEDGKYKWFEVIMVDTHHPSVKSDRNLRFLTKGKQTGRVFRGLTSSGRKARGLAHRGKKD